MDRELTNEEIRRDRRKMLLRIGIPAAVIIIGGALAIGMARGSVRRGELNLGTVDRGDIESTIQASGKVVPAFEQIITSPIASRVVEIYGRAGDRVEAGTPLLRLDLEQPRPK